MEPDRTCCFIEDATYELIDWVKAVQSAADSPFEAARRIVCRLGAHYHDGRTEIGFWVPELLEQDVRSEWIHLEILTPLEPIDFQAPQQTIRFQRDLIQLVQQGEYVWAVLEGLRAGTRETVGAFYWVKYQDAQGAWHTIPDPLALSVPFGAFAPAELYDMARLEQERTDRDHFARLNTQPDPDGVPRIEPPVNILQVHPSTASAEGTLAGLTRIYKTIAAKIRADEPLTPAEQNYAGYDAIQLMPTEPTVQYEAGPAFWDPVTDDPTAHTVTVILRRPDTTNWGYDVVIAASPAVNPPLLETGRPDEFVDFVAALHSFPGQPIMAMLDIVYGHADNQALPILNRHFFAGAGMYGQEMNFRHPVVRAMLLEMQRRKSDLGIDGVRVDGAQDFKVWDPETETHVHDDDFLTLMNNVEQEVAGQRYRPWMIFEDGRPWPRDDWELASTYREVTKQHPKVFQWGPLTFAHNTPFLFTFWISKWWRIAEIAHVGSHWITGCANHDTLRRGTQVDPGARINTYLGDTLPEIFKNAYDNPAAKLFDYAFMPGVPMDFINASMRAPWGFIRNTDDRYGVKVVSEESHFLDWIVNEDLFQRPETFARLKDLGFTALDGLRRFLHTLDHVVQITDYDLEAMVKLLRSASPPLMGPEPSVAALKRIARAWMDDVHDLCNVSRYTETVSAERARFNLQVRTFRRQRPWLMADLRPGEHFDHLRPVDGTVLFYGLRRAPDDREQVLFMANMEGEPRTLTPVDLAIPNLPSDGWQAALVTPGLEVETAEASLTLADSQGLVFTRMED
ncbi:MAG: glucosylglycerol hydrolase [Anaerolineae bacterium]|jgi:hypothetical protein